MMSLVGRGHRAELLQLAVPHQTVPPVHRSYGIAVIASSCLNLSLNMFCLESPEQNALVMQHSLTLQLASDLLGKL